MKFTDRKKETLIAMSCLVILYAITFQYSSAEFLAIRTKGDGWGLFYAPYIFSHVPLLALSVLAILSLVLVMPRWRHFVGAFFYLILCHSFLFLIEMKKEAALIPLFQTRGDFNGLF